MSGSKNHNICLANNSTSMIEESVKNFRVVWTLPEKSPRPWKRPLPVWARATDLVGEIAVASREKVPRWTRRTPTAVVTDGDFDELNV